MLQSFADAKTEDVWNDRHIRSLGPDVQRMAKRKLTMLHAAVTINDCRVPPGNRLERFNGDRQGQYSIRINDQFRICFEWTAGGPENVCIVDYH